MWYKDLGWRPSNFEKKIYRASKEMNMRIVYANRDRVDFVSTDKDKIRAFAEKIHAIDPNTKLVDIIGSRQDKDVKGNTLEGCTSAHLVDDGYYNWLIGDGIVEDEIRRG